MLRTDSSRAPPAVAASPRRCAPASRPTGRGWPDRPPCGARSRRRCRRPCRSPASRRSPAGSPRLRCACGSRTARRRRSADATVRSVPTSERRRLADRRYRSTARSPRPASPRRSPRTCAGIQRAMRRETGRPSPPHAASSGRRGRPHWSPPAAARTPRSSLRRSGSGTIRRQGRAGPAAGAACPAAPGLPARCRSCRRPPWSRPG